MKAQLPTRACAFAIAFGVAFLTGACSSSSPSDSASTPTSKPASTSGGCPTFDSSFAAIQQMIFEAHGCTADACHGSAVSGGLDLRPEVAWTSLVDAKSRNSAFKRVEPGTANQSFLYLKLKAGTTPGAVQVAGSPMPATGHPLSSDELAAVALWINKGAPNAGVVVDPTSPKSFSELLNACLPAAKPIEIKPLDPPSPDAGFQFVVPTFELKANSEVENCTPFYYDLSGIVPAQFKDVPNNVIHVNGAQIRQDPQSHHITLYDPEVDPTTLTDADFAKWTCRGGQHEGEPCTATTSCTGGLCAGPTTSTVGCAGMFKNAIPIQIANAQSATEDIPPRDGVYWNLPLRGIVGVDWHAFNVTPDDAILHARVNFYYTANLRRELAAVNVTSHIFVAAGQPPFTTKSYCETYEVAQGWSLVELSTHTHKHGTHFWVTDPSGKKFYDSYTYSDPLYEQFNPWMNFDSADSASRTIQYCATYNNGVGPGGSPDPNTVTRASQMPAQTKCTPVACVSGKVAASCKVNADCDTRPGAGDGTCDACPITAGTTTGNEMFVLMPWFAKPQQN